MSALPRPHAAGVDVDEIGGGVVADAAAPGVERRLSQLGSGTSARRMSMA